MTDTGDWPFCEAALAGLTKEQVVALFVAADKTFDGRAWGLWDRVTLREHPMWAMHRHGITAEDLPWVKEPDLHSWLAEPCRFLHGCALTLDSLGRASATSDFDLAWTSLNELHDSPATMLVGAEICCEQGFPQFAKGCADHVRNHLPQAIKARFDGVIRAVPPSLLPEFVAAHVAEVSDEWLQALVADGVITTLAGAASVAVAINNDNMELLAKLLRAGLRLGVAQETQYEYGAAALKIPPTAMGVIEALSPRDAELLAEAAASYGRPDLVHALAAREARGAASPRLAERLRPR